MPAAYSGPDALHLEVSSIETRMLSTVGAIDGVVVAFAAGANGVGTGYLATGPDGTTLGWKGPGSSSYGTYVDVSAGGSFVIEDGDDPDHYVRVTVTASRLPTSAAEARVLLRDIYNNDVASDEVTAVEAAAGDVEDYTIDVVNDSADGVAGVLVWVDAAVSGIEISADGVSYSTPTDEASAISLGVIAQSSSAPLYLRRTIAGSAASDPDVLTHLHYSFTSRSG